MGQYKFSNLRFRMVSAAILTGVFLFQFTVQAQVAVYVKSNGLLTLSKDSAVFKRMIYELDSVQNLFPLNDYYLEGGIKSRAFVSRVDPPLYEGQRVDYYRNGKIKTNRHFEKGQEVGEIYIHHPNGKLYAVMVTSDTIYNHMTGALDRRYLIRSATDSAGNEMVKEGNGHFIKYDEDQPEVIIAEGNLLNGSWDGEVKGQVLAENLHFTEQYQGGKLVGGISTDSMEIQHNYTSESAAPEYVGGMDKFYQFVMKTMRYPEGMLRRNIQGKTFTKFMIDTAGNLIEPQVILEIDPDASKEALRVLSLSGKWKPGTFKGMPVRCLFRMPFSFTTSNVNIYNSAPGRW